MRPESVSSERLPALVQSAIANQPIVDMHTHLYPPTFGTPMAYATGEIDPAGLMLWGIDELVTYHYLIAEVFRVVPASKFPYEQFWKMTREQQADHIWEHLFVRRTPLSEACRGVVTTLTKLGLDPGVKHLGPLRKFFQEQDPNQYIDRVMELAGVENITMTNAVFDDNERQRWRNRIDLADLRFRAVLRIDPMLINWPSAAQKLHEWGFEVRNPVDERTISNGRRFLNSWLDRMQAIYVAVSLPPEFRYPAESDVAAQAGQVVLEEIVLPVCAERNLPFAMMIGSRRQVNPLLRDAGDMGGVADVASVVNLCREFPHNRFFVTMLARENQHELAVAARKFGNLMVFGCWWFINNPSLIDEVTRMRMELLGTSFIPQHSDARILDQLIYKWDHSRRLIANVLIDKYQNLLASGWPLTEDEVKRDVGRLLKENFLEFLA
jgi:hypothetical protein